MRWIPDFSKVPILVEVVLVLPRICLFSPVYTGNIRACHQPRTFRSKREDDVNLAGENIRRTTESFVKLRRCLDAILPWRLWWMAVLKQSFHCLQIIASTQYRAREDPIDTYDPLYWILYQLPIALMYRWWNIWSPKLDAVWSRRKPRETYTVKTLVLRVVLWSGYAISLIWGEKRCVSDMFDINDINVFVL